MRRSVPLLSSAFCLGYLLSAVLIAAAASFRGMCGDGDFRPSCGMFAFGVALYGVLAIGAVTTIVTVVAIVLRRGFPQLLKVSSILYTLALAWFVLPVRAAGNKFAGAIVVMMAAPFSLLLLAAASACFVRWIGHATLRRGGLRSATVYSK
jgi:hypothetical protein